jgi:hypothetical protein
MDILKTTEPKSDQQNYDDYATAPKTVTVADVRKGSAEQPVEIHLVEFPGRPFKPSKSMRRVLVKCWGSNADLYKGRSLTLYGDASVRFGGQEVGGIRIAALSHIAEPVTIPLTVTRGKRAPFVVQPLGDDASKHIAALTGAATIKALQDAWQVVVQAGVSGDPALVQVKDARKLELSAAPPVDPADPTYVAVEA